MKRQRRGIWFLSLLFIINIFPMQVMASEPGNSDVSGAETVVISNEALEEQDEILTENNAELEKNSIQQNSVGNENPVNEARNGILQVNLVYIDGDNKSHVVRGGSGFLVGNEEGADYVITSNTNITVSDELRTSVGKEYKIAKAERKNMQFGVQVVVKRDVVVDAAVTTYSEQLNFAILQLSQTIYDRKPLQIEKNSDKTQEMGVVYALGFPEQIQAQQDVSYYTYEDVSVMNGIVSKKVTLDGTLYIQHSAAVTEGNAGGPILNEYGHVIGVNQIIMEDGYNYSVHISEVTSVMDALGIPYTEVIQEEIVDQVDIEPLQSAIAVAKEKDLTGYTEDSIALYNDALNQASILLEKENLTEEDIASGLTLVSNAGASLEIRSNNYIFFVAGGIILFLVLLVILLLVMNMRKSNKKDEQKENKAEDKPKKVAKKSTYEDMMVTPSFQPVAMRQETSVLNSAMGFDEGATTLLGKSMQHNNTLATLRRLKNSETINISKQVFYIGKDGLKSDYCIKGNPSISRSHAVIKQIEGEFYLEDLQATNGTYHNDVKLQPSQSVKLASGDRIRLANEEFVFSI